MCEQCEPLYRKPDRAGWQALVICACILTLVFGAVFFTGVCGYG